MSIVLYAFPNVGVITHLLQAFGHGCRRLHTHGYTQSTNTHGEAWFEPLVLQGLTQ